MSAMTNHSIRRSEFVLKGKALQTYQDNNRYEDQIDEEVSRLREACGACFKLAAVCPEEVGVEY